LKGGVLIPIRNFIKKYIAARDIISPIIQKGLSIPTSAQGILLFDFINPKEAGVVDENFMIYQCEKAHYSNDYKFKNIISPIEETLLTTNNDGVIKSDPCK
jgi:hypothetical protein